MRIPPPILTGLIPMMGLISTLGLAACTPEGPQTATRTRDDLHLTYACAGNKRLEVMFAADGETATVMTPDEVIPMVRSQSKTGPLYRATNPHYAYLLDRKGNTATLYLRAGKPLLTGCRALA